jgi:putative two-component system response regulator
MDGLRKMLIVDDLHLNRAILSNIFKDEFEILHAENGVEAMKIINIYKDEIVIVLLDLQMPLKSGYEVLSEIKCNDNLKNISVIVTTAYHDVKNEVKVLKLGADDFVNQPVEPEIIKCRVHNMVSKKEMDSIKEQNRILEITRKNEEIYKIIVEQVELIVFEWNLDIGIKYTMEGNSQFAFVSREFLIGGKGCTNKYNKA